MIYAEWFTGVAQLGSTYWSDDTNYIGFTGTV